MDISTSDNAIFYIIIPYLKLLFLIITWSSTSSYFLWGSTSGERTCIYPKDSMPNAHRYTSHPQIIYKRLTKDSTRCCPSSSCWSAGFCNLWQHLLVWTTPYFCSSHSPWSRKLLDLVESFVRTVSPDWARSFLDQVYDRPWHRPSQNNQE